FELLVVQCLQKGLTETLLIALRLTRPVHLLPPLTRFKRAPSWPSLARLPGLGCSKHGRFPNRHQSDTCPLLRPELLVDVPRRVRSCALAKGFAFHWARFVSLLRTGDCFWFSLLDSPRLRVGGRTRSPWLSTPTGRTVRPGLRSRESSGWG